MVCDICGQKGARVRYVTRNYGKDLSLRTSPSSVAFIAEKVTL